MDYLPGDLIGVRGSGWLSRGIIRATAPGPLSHIAIITATSPVPQTTEALFRVQTHPLSVTLDGAIQAWLMRDLALTDDDRIAMVAAIERYSADSYGYMDIGWQALDAVFQTRWFTAHLATEGQPICSMLAALGYRATSHPLDEAVSDKSITPNDCWRIWMANASRYRIIQLK